MLRIHQNSWLDGRSTFRVRKWIICRGSSTPPCPGSRGEPCPPKGERRRGGVCPPSARLPTLSVSVRSTSSSLRGAGRRRGGWNQGGTGYTPRGSESEPQIRSPSPFSSLPLCARSGWPSLSPVVSAPRSAGVGEGLLQPPSQGGRTSDGCCKG